MSINTVQQAFEEFERNSVRVPNNENQAAKKVQADFRDVIETVLGELYADSFLAGSYRRKTQAVHLKDLDIIFVLLDPRGEARASASGTLALMKRAGERYPGVTVVRTKCRAVECQLAGHPFCVDVVPALDDGNGGFLLAYVNAEEGADEWRPADPKGQTDACQKKNAETGGIYVPTVRVEKFWNGSFTSVPSQEKPMPSYLAEAILHDALSGPCEWAEATVAFFENAHRHLSLPWASVPCPGKSNECVDEKLDNGRRRRALAKVEVALANARVAGAETDPGKAMDAWVKVFGISFPAPSTDSNAVARALRNRTVSVVGAGVSASPSAGRQPIPARSHGPAPGRS
jgi:hypothetical protein